LLSPSSQLKLQLYFGVVVVVVVVLGFDLVFFALCARVRPVGFTLVEAVRPLLSHHVMLTCCCPLTRQESSSLRFINLFPVYLEIRIIDAVLSRWSCFSCCVSLKGWTPTNDIESV
ncbi:unnamed protein product, partial [Scytosiphon promiscuus]